MLRAVFEQINLFQFSYKDIDYSQLIAEINTLVARYNGLINTHASRNETRKKKAAVKLEQQNDGASKGVVLTRETSTKIVSEKTGTINEPTNTKVSSIVDGGLYKDDKDSRKIYGVYQRPDRKDG